MSTGLMSCVRENTPPLDNSEMQAEITTMSLPSEYSEPQKRRRFNALKNLRRIFRRRTVASAETLPSKGKIRSHISPIELEDSHFRDSLNVYKQPSLVSIRSTNEGRDYECSPSRSNHTIDCYDRGSSGGRHRSSSRPHYARQPHPLPGEYLYDECRRRQDRYHQAKSSLEHLDGRLSSGGCTQQSQQQHQQARNIYDEPSSSATRGDWTNGAHKRSHSEDRLKEGEPLDQEISKSHESVFCEPGDMAMLTIGLKSELIDVLRKRRSRPDANLNASLSPKRSSAEMYDLRNTLPTRKMIDPDSQVRLVGTDVPDQAPLPATAHAKMPLSPAKDPESSSGLVLLSHSAARHKMAVRPKKKGPTRFRRSVSEQVDTTESSLIDKPVGLNEAVDAVFYSGNNHPQVGVQRQMSGIESPQQLLEHSAAEFHSVAHSKVAPSNPEPAPRVSKAEPVARQRMAPIHMPISNQSLGHSPNSASSPNSANQQKKFSFGFEKEELKSPTRYITKSEEYLQEAGKDSHPNGSIAVPLARETAGFNKSVITAAAATPSCLSKIEDKLAGGRRRSVEKSQSFKIFSHNTSPLIAAGGPISNVADRKELFNMNRPVSYKEFPKPDGGLEFAKSDNRSTSTETKLSPAKYATDNILPIAKTNNIIQIEENIDKLVSSPFVPMLKSPAVSSSSPLLQDDSGRSKNNVSITTIRPFAPEVESTSSSASSGDNSPTKSPGSVHLRRKSSSIMEKSPSVGSLNTLETDESKVPEFLRIHLNRVENTRPKSSIVLYKGTSDTLPRRYSRELDSNKPPLPPTVSTLKRPSINKSQETITESNHVIIVPVTSPRKATVETPAPVAQVEAPTVPLDVPQSSEPVKLRPKSDCTIGERIKDEFLERKGSVSEEKAKIERRLSIADEKSFIRKKSIPTTASASKGSKKDDSTPELMKVFARRSMKLKDDDDDVIPKGESHHIESCTSSVTTDSDKENQSSSREELSPSKAAKVGGGGGVEEVNSREIATKADNATIQPLGTAAGYRARTFLEVKNLLQATNNGAAITSSSPAGSVLHNKRSNGVRSSFPISNDNFKTMKGSASAPEHSEMVRLSESAQQISSSLSVGGDAPTATVDTDKLPEFKRILERRAEWEKRAKMCK